MGSGAWGDGARLLCQYSRLSVVLPCLVAVAALCFQLFMVATVSKIVQVPSDRRIDEAEDRWTNERVSVVQGYAEKMHASNGSRLSFHRYPVQTYPIQVLSDNAGTSGGSNRTW